ncbi:hypothetical protein CRENBAI_018010, partial [Crenichthys baileyi]
APPAIPPPENSRGVPLGPGDQPTATVPLGAAVTSPQAQPSMQRPHPAMDPKKDPGAHHPLTPLTVAGQS